jgi:ankyrin repeat protein
MFSSFFSLFGGEKRRIAKLIAAARAGDTEKARKLLSKGVDINASEPESGDTPILAAIDKEQWATAQYLLAQKADFTLEDKNGNSPLYLAVSRGDSALGFVKSLLDAGAQVDLGPKIGKNAGATPLHISCAIGANACLEALIASGASVTKPLPDGSTPLHTAAIGGDGVTVDLLFKAGASVTALNNEKRTTLHNCGITGNTKVAEALLHKGLAVDILDSEGATPLLRSALANKVDMARFLIQNGANVAHVMGSGPSVSSPLSVAATNGFVEVVRVLIEAGADPNFTMGGETTILAMTKQAKQNSAAGILMNALKRKKAAEKKLETSPKSSDRSDKSNQSQSINVGESIKKSGSAEKMRASVNELGVICPSLRYDEYEHGKQLSKVFAKARAEWVKSKNDPSSSHYTKACKLIGEGFSFDYQVRSGFSLSLGLNEDNELDRIEGVGEVKNATEAIEAAFKESPVLKSFEIVWVDFRSSSSSLPLQDTESLNHSPEVGAIAFYQIKPNLKFRSPQLLSDFLTGPGKLVNECFAFEIKNEMIETVERDEDGDEYTSSNSTYVGGDIELVVNSLAGKGFRDQLIQKVREFHEHPSMISEDMPEIKRLMILGDEVGVYKKLDDGLPIETKVDGQTLLRLALMMAVTAPNWYGHLELSNTLKQTFPNLEQYRDALKRIALELLDRGANINAIDGSTSIMTMAELLEDPAILHICRARTQSGADADALSLLAAAEMGNVDSLRALVERGARVNKRDLFTGITPLIIASQGSDGEDAPPLTGAELECQLEAVKYLIDQGARLDAKADNGDTAVGNAVRRGNFEIVKMLLDAGAKTNDALPRSQTLVDLAKERGHVDVLKLLQKHADKKIVEPGLNSSDEFVSEPSSSFDNSERSKFVSAVHADDHEMVRKLIGKGVDLLSPDADGIPAFLIPVLAENIEMQRTFLSAGVSANLTTELGGVTALMIASAKGNRALVDILIDAGAELDKLMGSGSPFFTHPKGVDFELSALGCAVDAMHWDLASHLLDRGSKPIFGAMYTDIALTLAKFSPLSLIEKLHATGFSIVMDHQFNLLFAPPVEMHLPQMRSKVVFWAAVNPDPNVLPWVLRNGADPLAGNSLAMTSVIVAAAVGNKDLVKQLLQQGVDATSADCDGDTALSLAIERGHKEIVQILRKHSTALTGAAGKSWTLHQAAGRGLVTAVLDHLDAGVSPNLSDPEGNTPLMLAVKSGSIATIRILFANGASVRSRNKNGQSVWDMAVELNDPRVLVNLREFGAMNPRSKDVDERFSRVELSLGRYSHPFKLVDRNP